MIIEITVPQLPESVTDATLVAWHKKPGDAVSRDENLVDLETDKVVLEVPAPVSGTLTEVRVGNGTTVTAGDILAILEEGDVAVVEPTVTTEQEPVSVQAEQAVSDTAKMSPAVRRLLDEYDLDVSLIVGSGKDGRIIKSDVLTYLESHGQENVTPGDPVPELDVAPSGVRNEQRVPMSRLRVRIAERMVEAQHTAAMLTTFNEVDLTRVISLRKRYKASFEKAHGVRLGFMSFFAKAAVEALSKFPTVNASIEDNDIIYHDYVDIGVAVSSERGLMVPVLRSVEHMSFADIEKGIDVYAAKVQEGTISMDDLTGGTFTITNGGVFGSMLSTPILNPPQRAILGMHAIQERPIVIDGEITARPMMYLALTYDHRIIDGREAVQFLVSVKESLEDPGRLLLQV